MAKDPAVLLYTQDFLVGTSLLTPLQKGHYITLLCYQQQSSTGSLSVEKIKMLMGKDYTKQWPVIAHKFESDGDGFFNSRMRKEIERRSKYSDSRRSNRASKNPNISSTYVKHMETETVIGIKKGGVGGKIEATVNGFSGLFTIEHCMECALRDERFVNKNKTNKHELQQFNDVLERRGEYEKNIADYKSHFANWKRLGMKNELNSNQPAVTQIPGSQKLEKL